MDRILILGANYGLLCAMRFALGGHTVDIVCRNEEIAALNQSGIKIDIATRGGGERTMICDQTAAMEINGISAKDAHKRSYDFVVFAMQEGQFADPEIAALAQSIAQQKLPTISLMNISTAPFLKTLNHGWDETFTAFFHGRDVWDQFDPAYFSQSSPDPQIFKPNPTEPTHVQVRLASNFKLAPFANEQINARLIKTCKSSNAAPNLKTGTPKPRVNLVVGRSRYVALAKWPMLIAGNYRCVTSGEPIAIKDAVFADVEQTRTIYDQVLKLCLSLGASGTDLVPFGAYCKAAQQLDKPSSVSRAAELPGAKLERMDLLIHTLCNIHDVAVPELDRIVERIENKLN